MNQHCLRFRLAGSVKDLRDSVFSSMGHTYHERGAFIMEVLRLLGIPLRSDFRVRQNPQP